LAIDPVTQRPLLGAGIGGLSGPAIKPIALRAVWEVHRAGISIPLVGVGGIFSGTDVIEFLLAGASAVEIGTGVLIHGTTIFKQICDEMIEHLKQNNIGKLSELVGQIHDEGVES
ncbi:MAG: dihydroorotate dehydrogenase, partial [Candidatus Hermodarchaeota archaeon]|nr:dihydroorotate dehydrogenase [Candidatus Hermodarchaeota archaeon]